MPNLGESSVTLYSITEGLFRIHQITIRCQKGLIESNYEIYQTSNQKAYISHGLYVEVRVSVTMYGCIQGKNPTWPKS